MEPNGLSGGLALFWKNIVSVDFKFVNKNLLDCHLQFGSFNFFLSCVYGDPYVKSRSLVWKRLMQIAINRKDSWCMLGDFNEILHNGEKIDGPSRSEESFLPLGDMLS